MYTKEQVTEFKEMLDEYISTHLVEAGWWEGGETIRTFRLLDWLDKQVAPEYPCPVCGKEMRVIMREYYYLFGDWRAVCSDCKIKTYTYDTKADLHKALQTHWEESK